MNLLSLIYQELGKDLLPLRDIDGFMQPTMEPFQGSIETHAKSVMSNDNFFGLLYSKMVIENYRLYYYMDWISRVEGLQYIISEEIKRLE